MPIETNIDLTKDYVSVRGTNAAPAGGIKWRAQALKADCQVSYGTTSTAPDEGHEGFYMTEKSTHTISLKQGQFLFARNPRDGNSGILTLLEVD